MEPHALEVVDEAKAPEFFALPTPLLVDLLKLVGEIPARHGGRLFLELQRLKPISTPEKDS